MASTGMALCRMVEQDPECNLFMKWHVLYNDGQYKKAEAIEREIKILVEKKRASREEKE